MIIINNASYSNVSVTYTADGTQREFSFPFDYLRKAFVKVEVNEEIILVQGTDYTVSDNKTVVLTEAPESGTIVRVFRETSTTRLVSWADASVLRAKDMTIQQVQNLHILEEQQYWVTENAIIRQGKEWNARNFPIKNVGDPVDPKDATNKEYVDDNFMKLDDNGDYWVGRGKTIRDIEEPIRQSDGATKNYVDHVLAGLSITGDRVQTFNSVALMKEAPLEPGMVAMTTGYHNPNDGGASVYTIRTKTQSDVEDGGAINFLDNGNVAELLADGTVTPEQFGAKGDGTTDDATAINHCLQFASANKKGVLFSKMYGVSATIDIPRTLMIDGTNKLYCGLKLLATQDALIVVAGIDNAFVSISNIMLDGNGKATDVISIKKAYCNILGCWIRGGTNSAILMQTTYCNNICRNQIYGGDYGIICKFSTLTGQAQQNATSIIENVILFCNKFALVIGGGDSWLIERNTIEMSRLGVAIFTGCSNLRFSNNYLENDGKYSTKYTQTSQIFYIRSLIVLNAYNGSDEIEFGAGYPAKSVVIDNNFVNISNAADDNVIPEGYDDIFTFVLANGVDGLTISNNHSTNDSPKMRQMCFGSRRANCFTENIKIYNNRGFDDTKMLGNYHDGLMVKPQVDSDEVIKFNYFGEYDFSDATGVTLTDTGTEYYRHKVYECSANNTYGVLTVPKEKLQTLLGKTVEIGFFANVPTGASISFYVPGILSYAYSMSSFYDRDKWEKWVMALRFPDTLDSNLRFYFMFNDISGTPVNVCDLILTEVGNRINDFL